MHRLAIVGILLALAAPAHASSLADLEREQILLFEKVAPAVVYIVHGKSIGSGFFVREDLIVTNAHVVGKASTVEVVLHGGKRTRGHIIALAPQNVDLALVRVTERAPAQLVLETESLRIGAWVASVGHGVDSPWSFTTGMISNIFVKRRNQTVFQTQIPLNPGSSGGPIVDRNGAVLGVVTAGVSQSNSVNFALRASEIVRAFPGELSQSCNCLAIRAPRGVPILIDGEFVGVGPELLIPVQSGPHEITATVSGKVLVRTVHFPKTRAVELR